MIGQTMEQAGAAVEYLWCSGDPDSLDGVVLPELRCAIADGTSPHVLEPKYPAAVDRYVDLGRFYDLTAAKAAAGGRSPSAADQSGGVAVFLAHPRQITAQGRGHGGHFAAAHSLFSL